MTIADKLKIAQHHTQAGQIAEAERLYREVLDAQPANQYALRAMAHIAHRLGQHEVAAQWLELLVQATPNDAAVYSNLATTYALLGDVEAALSAYNRALTIDPNHAGYHYNLATLLKDIGQLDDALDQYREAIRLDPAGENPHAWSNVLYLIHFHPAYDPQRIYQEHVAWAAANAGRVEFDVEPHRNERSPDRKLKIGYVSPLLRRHAISFFMLPLVEHHDRERFDLTFYSDLNPGDDVTERYRAAGAWRATAGMSHAQVADLVRKDGIDILVDLNLHMANDRLEVFARKPAPVQVTYLGYPSTTGLAQMDWRITDAHLDPPGENDDFYFEKSYRLPWNFCYQPTHPTPEVNELPARANGHVTFGCLNGPMKINAPTLAMWAKVMNAASKPRLIVMSESEFHRRGIGEFLSNAGVAAERVEFVGHMSYADYFTTYHRIDIALDTLPYPGHTTTCDALWMGVPVVTLPGSTAASRGGVSIVRAVGLEELIATSVENYAERVAELSRNLAKLARRRGELRARMGASPLMDGARFARDFEHAYRDIWMQWTRGESQADK
jgi:protein O-GlcNAc transferase